MKWRKLGQVFCPDGHHPWMHSHAANPVPLVLSESQVRVFFSCRDRDNRSYAAFVDLDPSRGFRVTRIAERPSLEPGQLGTFDDSGVSLGCLLETPQGILLYYMGWNLKVTVPWGNAIGVARLDSAQERFVERRMAPLLDRSEVDPFTLSYPCVIRHQGLYRMYYGSSLSWGQDEPSMTHLIKYAESDDALHWRRLNQVAIPLQGEGEYALSRPWVWDSGETLEMLYSRRSSGEPQTYRIGYARSADGISWERNDSEIGIDISENGWDSEMISYPATFELGPNRYLLYVGNGYGRSGFGLAILEPETSSHRLEILAGGDPSQ